MKYERQARPVRDPVDFSGPHAGKTEPRRPEQEKERSLELPGLPIPRSRVVSGHMLRSANSKKFCDLPPRGPSGMKNSHSPSSETYISVPSGLYIV